MGVEHPAVVGQTQAVSSPPVAYAQPGPSAGQPPVATAVAVPVNPQAQPSEQPYQAQAAYQAQPAAYNQPEQTVVYVVDGNRDRVNHLLHFCITLFFWPWAVIWLALIVAEHFRRKKARRELQAQQVQIGQAPGYYQQSQYY